MSVVTASVGRRDALVAKATSLALQTFPRDRFEWRVALDGVDDAAATRIEADLRAALPNDLALTVVRTGGVGAGPARDAAAAGARFPVLLLSDDDCLLDPDVVARHAEAQRRPATYVGGVTFEPDVDARPTRVVPPRRPGWWRVAGANTSVPTEAFVRVGGFGTDLVGYGGEDVWLGWRLREAGVAMLGLPSAHVRHLGPDPRAAGDVAKGYAAGRNAARIARWAPATAWRLGVHPLLRWGKRLLFAVPVGVRTPRRAYERAYAEGVAREMHGGSAAFESGVGPR